MNFCSSQNSDLSNLTFTKLVLSERNKSQKYLISRKKIPHATAATAAVKTRLGGDLSIEKRE